MYLYSVRVNKDDSKIFPIFQFTPSTFNLENKLIIKEDDLKKVADVFSDIQTIEIFLEDNLLAVYTCFDSYSTVSLEKNQYDRDTGEWGTIATVTLTKVNIVEQVERLDAQINYVPDVANMSLDEHKSYLQEQNKNALSDFLASQTITFNDRQYGVSEEDQNEMALNLMQYQALSQAGQEVSLEWHSKKSKCETFTAEEFLTLTAMIKTFVYPYYQQMQVIKEQIFNAESKEDLESIKIEYKVMDEQEIVSQNEAE